MEDENVKVICSELTPIAEPKVPQFFNKRMYVWDEGDRHPVVRLVVAILPNCTEGHRVITSGGSSWAYCCEIGESEVKPRRATNLEFSRWLSQGNGQVHTDSNCGMTDTAILYDDKCDDTPVRDGLMARKWGDKEWHEPTIDYLGIKEG